MKILRLRSILKKSTMMAIILLPFCNNYSQNNNTASKKLTSELKEIYKDGFINGFSVAIVNKDSIIYSKGIGYADLSSKKKYSEHNVQNIGSISKTLIGVALLKAQELGKLNLDDPISLHLPFEINNPHFPNAPITIRHLATHTSSISDPKEYDKRGYVLKQKNNESAKIPKEFRSPDCIMEQETFIKKILTKKGEWYKKNTFSKNKPGTKFQYSNIGAGLAALIIENATKESFSQFTFKHILKPLNMSNSGWFFKDIDFSKHSKLYLDSETELAFYELINYPDGGLITSSNDLGKYLSELIKGYTGDGTILTKKSYKELYKSQITDEIHKNRNTNKTYDDEYDMGVFMGLSAKGQIGHMGGDPGIASLMFFNTETNTGKILIMNTELSEETIKKFKEIWKKLEEYELKL